MNNNECLYGNRELRNKSRLPDNFEEQWENLIIQILNEFKRMHYSYDNCIDFLEIMKKKVARNCEVV